VLYPLSYWGWSNYGAPRGGRLYSLEYAERSLLGGLARGPLVCLVKAKGSLPSTCPHTGLV
jgi:hypothetical protein